MAGINKSRLLSVSLFVFILFFGLATAVGGQSEDPAPSAASPVTGAVALEDLAAEMEQELTGLKARLDAYQPSTQSAYDDLDVLDAMDFDLTKWRGHFEQTNRRVENRREWIARLKSLDTRYLEQRDRLIRLEEDLVKKTISMSRYCLNPFATIIQGNLSDFPPGLSGELRNVSHFSKVIWGLKLKCYQSDFDGWLLKRCPNPDRIQLEQSLNKAAEAYFEVFGRISEIIGGVDRWQRQVDALQKQVRDLNQDITKLDEMINNDSGACSPYRAVLMDSLRRVRLDPRKMADDSRQTGELLKQYYEILELKIHGDLDAWNQAHAQTREITYALVSLSDTIQNVLISLNTLKSKREKLKRLMLARGCDITGID